MGVHGLVYDVRGPVTAERAPSSSLGSLSADVDRGCDPSCCDVASGMNRRNDVVSIVHRLMTVSPARIVRATGDVHAHMVHFGWFVCLWAPPTRSCLVPGPSWNRLTKLATDTKMARLLAPHPEQTGCLRVCFSAPSVCVCKKSRAAVLFRDPGLCLRRKKCTHFDRHHRHTL